MDVMIGVWEKAACPIMRVIVSVVVVSGVWRVVGNLCCILVARFWYVLLTRSTVEICRQVNPACCLCGGLAACMLLHIYPRRRNARPDC